MAPERRAFGAGLAALAAAVVGSAHAAEWRVTPSVLLRETWTDNINLAPGDSARSELVTEIAPGVQVTGRGARLLLNFDYRLTGIVNARDSERNRTQNSLAANANLEAIENFFFVDASASIAQESISAFGAQPASNISDTGNQTETRTYSVTPSIRGRLSDVAVYRAAYTLSGTDRKSDTVGDGSARTLDARVGSEEPLRNFSWSVEFNDRRNDFQQSAIDSETQLLRGILTYHVNPQFRVSGRVGRERNNYFGPRRSENIHGYGFEWAPTERTLVSGQNEERFFGRAFNYVFRHRTPRTVWNVQVVKDVTSTNDPVSQTQAASFADQLNRTFQLLNQQLAQFGLALVPTDQLGLLSARVFIERRTDASVALVGLRNTLTFGVSDSVSERIGQFQGILSDDFTTFDRIKQRSANVSLRHRLTPLSNLDATLATLRSSGSGLTAANTRQERLDILLSTAFGPDVSGSVGVRHVRFDGGSATSDYRENALFGSLTIRF